MMNMSSMGGGGSSMVVQSSSFSMNGQEVQVSKAIMWRRACVVGTAARCFHRSAMANTTVTSTSLLTAACICEQSSSTTARMGPGGVAEIQSQHRDSRGQERITMERRLGERARRVEKTYNRQTGEEETEDNSFGIEDG